MFLFIYEANFIFFKFTLYINTWKFDILHINTWDLITYWWLQFQILDIDKSKEKCVKGYLYLIHICILSISPEYIEVTQEFPEVK